MTPILKCGLSGDLTIPAENTTKSYDIVFQSDTVQSGHGARISSRYAGALYFMNYAETGAISCFMGTHASNVWRVYDSGLDRDWETIS